MIEVIFLKVITNLLFNAETDIFIMIKKKPGKLTIIASPLSQFGISWVEASNRCGSKCQLHYDKASWRRKLQIWSQRSWLAIPELGKTHSPWQLWPSFPHLYPASTDPSQEEERAECPPRWADPWRIKKGLSHGSSFFPPKIPIKCSQGKR